jgi:hypothetical protein
MHTIHIPLHAAVRDATPQKAAETPDSISIFQLRGALAALGDDAKFADATRINGLPFAADQVISSCVGPEHVALLVEGLGTAPSAAPPLSSRSRLLYMTQTLAELYRGCMVVLKVSRCGVM